MWENNINRHGSLGRVRSHAMPRPIPIRKRIQNALRVCQTIQVNLQYAKQHKSQV